jgi:hypothetical protein
MLALDRRLPGDRTAPLQRSSAREPLHHGVAGPSLPAIAQGIEWRHRGFSQHRSAAKRIGKRGFHLFEG